MTLTAKREELVYILLRQNDIVPRRTVLEYPPRAIVSIVAFKIRLSWSTTTIITCELYREKVMLFVTQDRYNIYIYADIRNDCISSLS